MVGRGGFLHSRASTDMQKYASSMLEDEMPCIWKAEKQRPMCLQVHRPSVCVEHSVEMITVVSRVCCSI